MDDIERTITLPKGAQPLSAYGRNSRSMGTAGSSLDIFYRSIPPKADEGWLVLLENFESRPAEKGNRSIRSIRARLRTAETLRGRAWYSNGGACLSFTTAVYAGQCRI